MKIKLIALLALLIMTLISTPYASEKKQIGTGLLEYSIFKIDIYQVTYFKSKDMTEELVLDYKMDIKKEHSVEGWKVGLKHVLEQNPSYKEKVDWIKAKAVDLKEGDKFTLRRNKDKVTMLKNSKVVAEISDKIIASIIFEPWLGTKPVDEELKEKLLKNI